MGKLSDLVKRDYDEEVTIIREAGGNLWLHGAGMAFILALLWGFGLVFSTPWTRIEIGLGMVAVVAYPFINRAWERYKVAGQMTHEREVRVEMKLNALLGLVNINEFDDE